MTKQQLINEIEPFFYGSEITIKQFDKDDISVYIDGLYFNREMVNSHTGIDLDSIRLVDEHDLNLDLWKEIGKWCI